MTFAKRSEFGPHRVACVAAACSWPDIRSTRKNLARFLKGTRGEFIRILVVGLIFTPCQHGGAAEEFGDIGCEEAPWRGKFHFCRRPFVVVLAPAAHSLEATTAPTRLIASSRPLCAHLSGAH